eukprot:GFUD01096892.1.p1 GENE.GFUD01096892.1~~GFUD01096892.1.p1  ORF type:complete len:421 (-),score=79.06 GFUD01096892.1:209-1471(-)
MTERRRHSLERYHPPRRPGGGSESWEDEELNTAVDNLRVHEGQGREFGRGRGQHRWDSGRNSQRGNKGGMRGRGRGWNREASDSYHEGHDNRYSPRGSSGQYEEYEGEEPAHYDLREELNHGHFDLRKELNQKNLHRTNEASASGYDLRDELNHKRATDQEHREGQDNDQYRGHNRRGYEKNGNRGYKVKEEKGHHNKLPRPKKNTENFNPSYEAPPMRVVVAPPGLAKYNKQSTTRDVIIVNDLFGDQTDKTYYNKLLKEIKESGIPEHQMWKQWHGDSHLIADDKRKWKESCPTFAIILDKIKNYFDMDIKATRLNWYRDTSEWKPFHHDAAAMKANMARTQNFTVAVSFGCERDVAFENAETKTVIAMPQPNGTVYTFGKDVNILWRHGILQVPPELQTDEGRISIVAWGWVPQTEL